MSDAIRDKVLLAALAEIPPGGITDATLAAAAAKAGVGKRELADAFPKGPVSLIEAFSHWADQRMIERMKVDTSTRMRERLTNAVRARIEVLVPHKEAARRATVFLAAPQHAALGAQLAMKTVDAMWRAAGDRSSDFSYYTKRATLAGVYGTTFAYWLNDSSEGNAATWTFLANRIDNVMQIEKFKGAAKNAIAKLPNPLDFFSSWRGGNRPR
jgi:ubiquinone biosynthesis protein COQ9